MLKYYQKIFSSSALILFSIADVGRNVWANSSISLAKQLTLSKTLNWNRSNVNKCSYVQANDI